MKNSLKNFKSDFLKCENNDNDELPALAQHAFENYPQIAASPDFNRRVLERVLAARAPSRLELCCDRLDEIFARPILKLLGAACLGAVLALAGTGLLFGISALSTPVVTPTPTAPQMVQLGDGSFLDSHNRLALMRDLENSYSLRSEYSERNLKSFDAPAKREKSVEETSVSERSSQCPVAFASLA